jgi:hypothetical protein
MGSFSFHMEVIMLIDLSSKLTRLLEFYALLIDHITYFSGSLLAVCLQGSVDLTISYKHSVSG